MLNAIQSPASNAPLLQLLRNATNRSHKEIDAAFSHIDLSSQAGYARFLSAHLAGIVPVFRGFRAFVEEEPQLPPPDFPAMLRFDLFQQALRATDSQIVTLG